MLTDEVPVSRRKIVQSAQNLCVDDPLGEHPHRGVGYRCLPLGEVQVTAEIDVQKTPSRAQYARYFGEETRKVWVTVRGFDIEHRVEGLIGEGQILGIAVHEIQPGQTVPFPAEGDGVCV